MGISNTQYRDIMFQYDQTQLQNKRLLDQRYAKLYALFPELKEIHNKIVELSVEQARKELLSPDIAKETLSTYQLKKEELLQRKEAILTENGYPKDYLSPIYTCKDCKDTGYIDNTPCHCLQSLKFQVLYENSNLQNILEEENFSHFEERYYDDTEIYDNLSITARENILRVKEICLDFIKHFDSAYENILFYGPTGVGKTFLTHCIAKELLDTGHTVVYLTSLQLFDILERNVFNKEENAQTNEQVSYVFDCDLLIIDDLGTELSNSFTVSKLYELIEKRHTKKRSTIISTNLSFSDIRERYSERILSRFTGYYDFKQIVGKDIRILKAIQH